MIPGRTHTMWRGMLQMLAAMAAFAGVAAPAAAATPVVVGSKAFPESWILGAALTRQLERDGVPATHRRNLGGTDIVWQALTSGGVDVYPEYTGTIAEVILKTPGRTDPDAMRAALAAQGVGISAPIGFNDGYAIAVTADAARRDGLTRLSDLAAHPDLRLGLSHEFLGRADGWPGLAKRYGLERLDPTGIQHELAYAALAAGRLDGTDIYTTDAEIADLHLVTLVDDRGFFPRYDAVWLYRLDLARRAPRALAAIRALTGRIGEREMIHANARVVLRKADENAAADSLLMETLGAGASAGGEPGVAASIARNTLQHLKLVGISLGLAIVLGVPFGVLATRSRALAQLTLSIAGLLQTVPSLALLAFLIPLLGIGAAPALVALFLYSLLPIVRNTYVGLTTIPPALDEAAAALGLSPRAQLLRVRLPMAMPAVMAGIKTSAVINVGTATLAALVGAGGLGDPILTGIQLRRHALILQGAIPAAALALLVQALFDALDRVVVPKGLRLRAEGS
ncbi:MAG TPA: glycine betaine ABC transporter substrate-binding protein [Candidatus Eisenbacteria bacterium]|nr:glycine betaine ABC transporter substrate-binding protein [Candidatus Eisenbacteria bacterium]